MGYNVENSNGNASNKAAALQIISSSIDAKYGLHPGLHLAAARIGYLTYSDQYPTRESGDKVACLDKVLLSFVGLQCGSML